MAARRNGEGDVAQVRFGVVGVGQGRSHIRGFQSQAESTVVAVCDADLGRATAVAQEYGVDRRYQRLEELLDQRDIDAVVIATPDHLHGPMSIAALRAGKHVLSEIPMALEPTHMREIVELTDRTGLKYHMANQTRFAPALISAKAVVSSGRLGELFYGEAEYLHDMRYAQYFPDGRRRWRADPEHPQTTLLGGGPHALDTLRWLMGIDQFVEVTAYGNRKGLTDRPTDDFTVALFKAADGSIAKVAVAYGLSRPYCLYFSVYGTEGSFERTRHQRPAADTTTNYLYTNDIPYTPQMTPMEVYHRIDPAVPQRAAHGSLEIIQAREFLRAVREDRLPPIHAREAARSCLALWAGLESARLGRPVAIEPVP